ncbi:MAG: cohesin domain-containing protein [Candidatus Spechtbacterales bacterium]
MIKKFTSILIVSVFLLTFNFSQAATLYIDPPDEPVSRHDTFTAKVRIDPGENCINAADVEVNYPIDILRVIDVSTGDSIFTLWPEPPSINTRDGVVRFMGGIPGGYCGRIPGDPGLTNVLATLVFQAPGAADTDEVFPVRTRADFSTSSKVYLHDGLGTEVEPQFFGAEFELTEDAIEGSGQWFEFLAEDATEPSSFTIELTQDSTMFDGKYFIIFSSNDKESGISHYEVMETRLDEEEGLFARFSKLRKTEEIWKKTESPYVLNDQSLNSMIMVRAVDKAGNERIESLAPPEYLRRSSSTGTFVVLGVIFLILAGTAAMRYMYPKLKNTQ